MLKQQERKIETLLKASKARRLDKAGIPEMHPAMRETLRTEVQRQYGNSPPPLRRSLRWYLGLLPKLAVFVTLGLCAWLVVLREDSRIPGPLALNQSSRGMEQLNDEVMEREEPPAIMSFDPVARGTSSADQPSGFPARDLAATPSAGANMRLMQKASRAQTGPTQEEELSVVGAEYFKADRQGMYMGIASTEAAGEPASNTDSGVALGAFMETGSVPTGAGSQFSAAPVDSVPSFPVLQDFTLLVDGSTVQIIDADGSIYKGRIRPMQQLGTDASRVSSTTTAKAETTASPTLRLDGSTEDPDLLNFHLVASGHNRRLDQTVHFMGNLFLTEEQLRSGPPRFHNTIANAAGRLSKDSAGIKSAPPVGRLRGTALLDDGRGLAVDATPTAP